MAVDEMSGDSASDGSGNLFTKVVALCPFGISLSKTRDFCVRWSLLSK